ncbi:MAG: UDP-N-acetylmuramoyl-L-alanine--D-glutamate ligase [Bacteroidota bacterium]|nr:UDP-N-acetylmuramoyl-L-alanine--D-glutamate ligase [Bacteroidota bacterium]
MKKRVSILGSGISGIGAAILAKEKGYDVFVSDINKINSKAKNKLDSISIPWEENNHSYNHLKKSDLIIKSPGISNESEIVVKLRNSNVDIISEIEFASLYTNAFIIGITGSNGKTTTTELIYHILKESGLNVGIAGNIGTSFSKQIAENSFDYYVLEISSFQLDNIIDFKPNIAIITNLVEDHLDRYNYDFNKYIDSKLRITMNQENSDTILYNIDDESLKDAINNSKTKASKIGYAINTSSFDGKNILIKNKKKTLMINIEELSLKGRHNLLNAMVAITVADLLKISKDSIRDSLLTFKGLPHRLENVLTIQGVNYINDSKATNVNAAYYALDSMNSQTVWVVGGVDKGNDYSELLPLVREKVKAIICLGVDNKKIIETFSPIIDLIVETESMDEAVKISRKIAEKKDNVLLSPACASFDLFKDYEDRGNQFKEAVRNL